MNAWMSGAAVLTTALLFCGAMCLLGSLEERIASLQLASTIGVLALLAAAMGYDRAVYADVAIVLAILSFGGTLALVRFTERWF